MGPEYAWVHATGPLLAYMAACNGPCDQFEPEGKVWFKIYETGLINGGGFDKWGNRVDLASSLGWDQFEFGKTGWSLTIPKNLKPGNYLIRHEIIMIEIMPPQFYPECAQLTVTGDGDKLPGEEYLVSFPGGYSMDGKSPRLFLFGLQGKMLIISPEPGLAVSGDLYSPKGHATFVSLTPCGRQCSCTKFRRTTPFRAHQFGPGRINSVSAERSSRCLVLRALVQEALSRTNMSRPCHPLRLYPTL